MSHDAPRWVLGLAALAAGCGDPGVADDDPAAIDAAAASIAATVVGTSGCSRARPTVTVMGAPLVKVPRRQ